MSEDRRISFTTEKTMRYPSQFDIVNCEKVCMADVDGDGQSEIVIARYDISRNETRGILTVYDLDLNLKASDDWDGAAMDLAVADIDDDGVAEIIVAGGIKGSAPVIKVYKYNEDYKGNLGLYSQTAWKSPEGLFCVAKAIHIADMDEDGRLEIAVLTVVEGTKERTGYAQLRLYDADMQLKRLLRWTPTCDYIVKWGHCMTSADMDGDGHEELVTLINYRHGNTQKADLRVFDRRFLLKRRCECIGEDAVFATCMAVGDVDSDGKTEVVVAAGTFPKVWKGVTSQLMIFDDNLELKGRVTWKTFRHSWVWDLQIADIDGDGSQEIITYGGTSMRGRNQNNANVMAEIRLWGGRNLTTEDIFIWQRKPGEDTRYLRGIAFKDDGVTRFLVVTSRWSEMQRSPDLEIRWLNYVPCADSLINYSDIVYAYEERISEALEDFAVLENVDFAPLALEILSICADEKAAELAGRLLLTEDQALFMRTVELMRNMGAKALDELHRIGFALPDDWVIVSPFDNTDNSGFDKQYPPELETDLDAFYAGKDKIIGWGKIDDYKPDIYVDLGYTHFESFERTGIELHWNNLRTEALAYAEAYILSPAKMEALLKIGSSDGVKVWLDGDLKYTANVDSRRAVPDQEIVPVSLAEGRNRILLKIANYKTNGWGFFFRVTDVNGKPIPGLKYERPETSHTHNQMLAYVQLLSLLEHQDDELRCLAAGQLASMGSKIGNESLVHLLQADDEQVRVNAALALATAGDVRGSDVLVDLSPKQDYLFQITASHALKRIGDERAGRFRIDNLTDDAGKKVMELKVEYDEEAFRVTTNSQGHEAAHVEVQTDRQLHLGYGVSANCPRIASFGIREPKYRGMGLGGIAIRKACDLMAERGFTCSTVSTGTGLVAHRLYCRHGYVDRRFPWHYEKQLEELDSIVKDVDIMIRDYKDMDESGVRKLRVQYCANTVGPANWLPRSVYGPWIWIAEYDGKIIGYADLYTDPFEPSANINLLHVDKDFHDEQKAVKAMLSGIHRYVLDERKRKLIFEDPPVRYRDILLGMGYNINRDSVRYGWVNMLKVIDLRGFLNEISNLLNIRLKTSAYAGWCGSIRIKGSRLAATITINNAGEVSLADDVPEKADILITADDRTITSLVSGNEDVWESYRQHRLGASPAFNQRIRGLIESLFPIMPHRQGGRW